MRQPTITKKQTHYWSQNLIANVSWIYVRDVDVAALLIAHHNLLSCRNILVGVSAGKTNINSLFVFLGSERAKCLLMLFCFTGCDTVGTSFPRSYGQNYFCKLKIRISLAFESMQEEVMPIGDHWWSSNWCARSTWILWMGRKQWQLYSTNNR